MFIHVCLNHEQDCLVVMCRVILLQGTFSQMVEWIQCRSCTISMKVCFYSVIILRCSSNIVMECGSLNKSCYFLDDLAGFEETWKGKARKSLPGWSEGFNVQNGMVTVSLIYIYLFSCVQL